ncbi:NADH ubiquinone oxidoreductase subunit [Apiospora sp. TS-2023a]
MSSSNVGLVMRAWFRWKALRLPWRKRFLVGSDLSGNTYWVFRLTGNTPPPSFTSDGSPTPAYQSSADDTRWRRIVKYPRSTHLSDVHVPPQWHQWLRYQRQDPPTISEQQGDVLRLARMKVLAAEADARWAAKPSFLDQPEEQPKRAVRDAPQPDAGVKTAQGGEETVTEEKKVEKDDPWKKAATGPSEDWQPAAWSPSNSRKR